MNNKRGQFYLIAATIIIVVLISLSSVRTYAATKPQPRAINDLGYELKEESFRIVEYGILNKTLNKTILNFTKEEFGPYFLRKTNNATVVFIYGNASEMYYSQYIPDKTGIVYATIGGASLNNQQTSEILNITRLYSLDNKVKVGIFGKNYTFDINENQMFYFVMVAENEKEVYVKRN
ncbi:MAG: hypothetical protein ACP5OG_00320 [Candidatus Nanoarchaeia archaeon]